LDAYRAGQCSWQGAAGLRASGNRRGLQAVKPWARRGRGELRAGTPPHFRAASAMDRMPLPSSQALLGYLITAPLSVCVPDVISVLAVWIQNKTKNKKISG